MWGSTLGCLVTLTLSLLVASLPTEAQQATKVHRIGWLSPGSPPSGRTNVGAFQLGAHDLGYVEGQTLVIEYRYAEGKVEQLPELAAELVRLQVEVIVAGGMPAIRASQHATRTIPIVMAGTSDPVGAGFVASLARPGGNITGLSFLGAELPGKRLELLKEMVPQSARVAVLANPADPTYEARMHNLRMAAQALGLHLRVLEVRSADELDATVAAMPQERADALIVLSEPALMAPLRGRVVAFAAESRLPAIYDWKFYVEAGGLMSYGPSTPSQRI
jgi:putative ABC transport system substrate-binding protein